MVEVKKDKAPLFYPLTNQEWRETVKNLTGAEIKVLYHLRSLDPFGDRLIEYSITQMAEDLGLSKGAVSKAVKKLDSMDLVDAELVRVKIRISPNNNNVTEFPKRNSVSYRKQPFPIGNEDLPEETEISYEKQPLPIGNDQQSEPLPDKDSSLPHTIYTYSDFINTLSDTERENFRDFCKTEVSNYQQPVVDIDDWLAGKNKAGENRYDIQYQKYLAAKEKEFLNGNNSTNGSTHCGAATSTKVQNFESWNATTHEGQYHTLISVGLTKFCENPTSKAWYEWAIAKHPERFIEVPE
jgi:DNA-binding transcriptional ArsR family regulator